MSDVLEQVRSRHRGKLAQRVADGLVEQIGSGRWKPGERLPPEHDLAALLGVSRSSIREGIKRVQAQGLLRVEHGRGVFVLEATPSLLLPDQALALIFGRPDKAQEVHEARLVLELGLTELAAQRASSEDVAALEEAVARARALLAGDDPAAHEPELFELGFEFHLRLARAAHSPLLASLYELLLQPLHRTVQRPHEARGDAREDLGFHVAVIRAIERRDAAAATAVMRAHVERTAALGSA